MQRPGIQQYGGYQQPPQYGMNQSGYAPQTQQQYGGYQNMYQNQFQNQLNHPLRVYFNAVDIDRSGKITWPELQKALTQPGGEFVGKVFNDRCRFLKF